MTTKKTKYSKKDRAKLDEIVKESGTVTKGLILLTRLEDLSSYLSVVLVQFPRYERYALCSEIRKTMENLIRLTIEAGKRYYKRTALEKADIELEYLRVLFRRCASLKYFNDERYKVTSSHVVEIGNLLGGWLKNVRAKESKGKVDNK